jgi:hypothetical protein
MAHQRFQVGRAAGAPGKLKTAGGFAVRQGKDKGTRERARKAVEAVDTAVQEVREVVERNDFQQRADVEKQRFEDATDAEFVLVPTLLVEAMGVRVEMPVYPAVVFQTRAEKDEFLAKMNERFPGQILGDKYISGELLAEALGFELTSRRPDWPKPKGPDKKLQALR